MGDNTFRIPSKPATAVTSPKDLHFTFSSPVNAFPNFFLNSDNSFTRESLGVLPNTDLLLNDSLTEGFKSPRESLGVLNISAMDLGRDSVAIYDIRNSGSQVSTTDPPHIILSGPKSDIDRRSSVTHLEFNLGFLMPDSKRISYPSSGSLGESTNPSFNVRSLEEPSKISFTTLDTKSSSRAVLDPLNDAFRFPSDLHSISFNLANKDVQAIRERIRSLPLVLGGNELTDGLRTCEESVNESVFLSAKTEQNCKDTSFDEGRYLLDSTPQPDWDEWDSSKSQSESKPSKFTHENVLKTVDKMFGMQPENLEEKFKLKCDSKSISSSSINISKISRASQCNLLDNCSVNSNNLSRILHLSSEANVSGAIKHLSNLINHREDLSISQRKEGHLLLNQIANLLNSSLDLVANSEDSGHSSVAEEKHCERAGVNHTPNNATFTPEKNVSKSIETPPLPEHAVNQAKKNEALGTNIKNRNSGASSSRQSISQLKRAKTSISKFQPLKATLPIEIMLKNQSVRKTGKSIHVTPERKLQSGNFAMGSSKTSTPLQATKLSKPMAASTPTTGQGSKPSSSSSFACTSTSERLISGKVSKRASGTSVSKDSKFIRRNSLDAVVPKTTLQRRDSELPTLKRSFSTGKEPKIVSALAKVRQNLLNSPYYKSVKEGSNCGSKGNKGKKVDKENVSPDNI